MQTEKLLKALANKRRLGILKLLEKDVLTVTAIAIAIHLSVRSTSKHLQILSKAEMIEHKQVGLNVHYHLSEPRHPLLALVLTLV